MTFEFGAYAGVVYLAVHDCDGTHLLSAAVGGAPPAVFTIPEVISCDGPLVTAVAYRTGRTVASDAAYAISRERALRMMPYPYSVVAVPLIAGDEKLGVYTPSPEAQFPVPIEQAYTVAQWVARNGRTIDIDPTRLAIAGDSVGGDMTAAVTLMAKQRGGPHFVRQVLLYPVTDARFDTASYNRFAEGCWLTRPAMKWFWDAYAPDPAVRAQPLASPLNASVDQLRGLPEALMITDSDALLDAANAYAAKLQTAGVPVTLSHYGSITHDFMMLDALAGTQAAKDAVAETTGALREALYAPRQPGRGK